jgi:hypothetical protein
MKILKAGKYYVGDPCYVFDNSWSEVLEQTDYFDDEEAKLFDKEIFAHGTAWGDGSYKGSDGISYCVDAGLIGCIPYELTQKDSKRTDEQINELVRIVEFAEDFLCKYIDGTFYIGNITIKTGDEL